MIIELCHRLYGIRDSTCSESLGGRSTKFHHNLNFKVSRSGEG